MNRICPACAGSNWEPFLDLRDTLILTGDQRIEAGSLSKIICAHCGVVANTQSLSNDELRMLYGEAYQLNTLGREEHLFFTANGPLPRSQVVFEWLAQHLPEGARSALEIGCGEGNVLARFAASNPSLQLMGFEGSRKAAELARAKGLNVRNELILSNDQSLPLFDFVFSYNVLEHIEDIDAFISVLKSALAPGARIVFGLPVQDDGGYDLFFAEHVWHFTSDHVRRLLERRGLHVLYMDAAHPVNRGAGLFVCSAHAATDGDSTKDSAGRSIQFRNRDYWLNVFNNVDELLTSFTGTLAVYGSSEVFSLLMCHTSLRHKNIAACLDEDLNKVGRFKQGIPVHHPDHLKHHPIDAVLLTVNPRYNDQIRAKLALLDVRVLSCFD